MSRTYGVYINLKTDEPVHETDVSSLKRVMVAAVDDPESLIETGLNVITDETASTADFEADTDDGKSEFTLNRDRLIGGWNSLDDYLACLVKAIYLATKPLCKSFRLRCSVTDLEPDPEVCEEFTYVELQAKYEPSAQITQESPIRMEVDTTPLIECKPERIDNRLRIEPRAIMKSKPTKCDKLTDALSDILGFVCDQCPTQPMMSCDIDAPCRFKQYKRLVQWANGEDTGLIECDLCGCWLDDAGDNGDNLIHCDLIDDDNQPQKTMRLCNMCLDADQLDAKIRTCPQCDAFVDQFVVKSAEKCPECGFIAQEGGLTWI